MTDSARLSELLAHRDWVRGLARSLVLDESRADDLAQETWLRALKSPPAQGGSPRAWLRRVLKSAWIDAHRSETQRAARERAVAADESTPHVDVVAQVDAHRRVVQIAYELDEPYRTTLLLRYFEGLSVRDVASRLGVPEETVHTRLRRALARMRERLDAASGGDRNVWCAALVPLAIGAGGVVMKTGTKAAIAAAAALLAIGGATAVVMASRASTDSTRVVAEGNGAAGAASTSVRTRSADETPAVAAPAVAVVAEKVTALSGEVLAPDGRPAAKAVVVLVPQTERRDDKRVPPKAETDSAGRFAFSELAPEDYALDAWSPGVGAALRPRVRVEKGKPAHVVIRLESEVAVSGVVVAEEDGKPVAGATVRADALAPAVALACKVNVAATSSDVPREARTGADGRFRLVPLLAGPATLTVEAPGRVRRDVTVRAPSDGVTVPLALGGSIRAVVTALGDAPPAELLVSVMPGREEERRPTTGRETVVVVDSLPPGDAEIRVRALGHGMARAPAHVEAGKETAAPPLVLDAPTIVKGSVREAGTGKPVAGAKVAFQWIERTTNGSSGEAEPGVTTDASGEWTTRLRAGEWRAETSKPGYVLPAEEMGDGRMFVVGREPLEVALRLRPAPAIVGRVTYQDGGTVAGATVAVVSVSTNPDETESTVVGIWPDPEEVATAGDGSFRIVGTPVHQKYDLLVKGPAGERASVADVAFEKGALEKEVTIRIDRGAAGAVLGRVVDEAGRGIEGALVSILRRRFETDADGAFRADDVAAGKVTAIVGALGFAIRTAPDVEVTAGRSTKIPDVVLRRRGLRVHGRILDSAGAPVREASVWTSFGLTGDQHDVGGDAGFVGPDGAYSIDGPDEPPQDVIVYCRAPGFTYTTREAKCSPDAELDIVLTRESTLDVVVSFDGAAPADVVVLRLRENEKNYWDRLNTKWDAGSQTARVANVRAGTTEFGVQADGYAPGGFQTAVVAEGARVALRAVRLTAGGTLAGRVLDAAGKPLPDVQVACEEHFIHSDTGPDGKFRLEHLPPGRFTFDINGIAGAEQSPKFTATIEEGRVAEVEWTVGR